MKINPHQIRSGMLLRVTEGNDFAYTITVRATGALTYHEYGPPTFACLRQAVDGSGEYTYRCPVSPTTKIEHIEG